MTTEQYLNQLKTDKQNLVNNLVEKGVSATNEETFTTLVPKVLDISGGGSEDNLDIEFIYDKTTSSSLYPNKAIFKKGSTRPSIDNPFVPGAFLETPGSWGSLQSGMFSYIEEITLSSDITVLREGCFKNLRSLKNINLENITEMMQECFKGCSSLILNEIPDSIVLANSVFYDCKKITVNKLPSATTSVGKSLFYGCTSITNFTINDGVDISNSTGAFQRCTSMTNINIPNDATIIPNYFCGYCSALENINLNDNINAITNFAFSNCGNLLLEKLPSNLEKLGAYSFEKCASITISEIPAGVTNIQAGCFSQCSNLVTLNVLGDITMIEGSSFYNSGLATLSLPNVSAVPTGGNSMFWGTPIDRGTGSIYVPDALVENFKSATNWSNYADVIKPISEMA